MTKLVSISRFLFMMIGSRRSRLIIAAAPALAVLLFVVDVPAGATGQPDPAEVLVGAVTVQSLPNGDIAVALNQFGAGEPDDTAERVFILQTTAPMPADLPIQMEAAQVIVKPGQLLVVSLEEPRALALHLVEVDQTALVKTLEAMLAQRYGRTAPDAILTHAGYGLADHRAEYDLPIRSWPPQRPGALLMPKDGIESQSGACQSGGPGSTSCSITCPLQVGCSVDCSEGYYACCKCGWTPSCDCVNPGGDGSGECPPLPCVP